MEQCACSGTARAGGDDEALQGSRRSRIRKSRQHGCALGDRGAAASKADAAFSRGIRRGGYLHTRMDCCRGATFRPREGNAAHLTRIRRMTH